MNRVAAAPNFDAIVDSFEDNQSVEAVVAQFAELLLGIDRDSDGGKTMISAAVQQTEKQPKKDRWAFASHLLLNSSSIHLC